MLRIRERNSGGRSLAEIVPEFDEPRLESIRLLHEASRIEHLLLLQHLYARASVRSRYPAVAGSLFEIARWEMTHLRDANRILVALGAHPSLDRPDFPLELGADTCPMELERLSRRSLAKYVFLVAPPGAMDPEGSDPELARDVLRELREAGAGERPTSPVGAVYRASIHRIGELHETGRQPQAESWIEILERIRRRHEEDHFDRFRSLFRGEFDGGLPHQSVWELGADDERYPSRPLPRNPSALRNATTMPEQAGRLGRIGNLAYWACLLLLEQAYREDAAPTPTLVATSTALMVGVLDPLAALLAENDHGLPFDAPRTGCLQPVESLRAAADLLEEAVALAADVAPADPFAGIALQLERTARATRDLAYARGTVVVVGAGPAGLAAAFALADRGVPVQLLEQARVVGGKVSSEEIGRDRLSVEHGVHGWWGAYRNFFAILERSGVRIEDAFVEAEGTTLVVEPGNFVEMRPLRVRLPSPLFLAAQLLRSGYTGGVTTLFRMLRFSIHVLAFRHGDDDTRYDGESLEDFLQRVGVPRLVRNFGYILPSEASAAAILSAFQFYVLPSQDALLPLWTRGLPNRVVFGPIVKAIEARAGRVQTSSSVGSFVIANGCVEAVEVQDVTLQAGRSGDKVLLCRVPEESIPEVGWKPVQNQGRTLAFVRRESDGGFGCFLSRCTHQGGELEFSADLQRFVCKTHGGMFDASGALAGGLPRDPLTPQPPPEKRGADLFVYGHRGIRTMPCSHAILATDLEAAKEILERSDGVPTDLLENIRQLETTPVLVVRMWFKRGTRLAGSPTAVTQACQLVDNYFHLNAIDRSYDREGEVMEIQGAREFDRWGGMSDPQIVDQVLQDLQGVGLLPASLPAPLHTEVMRHPRVFTKYAPGQAAFRPGVDSGVAGLYLAGDWTHADWSAWFMEHAVVSGLRAANAVLEARGLPPFEIRRLPREGLLLRVSRRLARVLRRLID